MIDREAVTHALNVLQVPGTVQTAFLGLAFSSPVALRGESTSIPTTTFTQFIGEDRALLDALFRKFYSLQVGDSTVGAMPLLSELSYSAQSPFCHFRINELFLRAVKAMS